MRAQTFTMRSGIPRWGIAVLAAAALGLPMAAPAMAAPGDLVVSVAYADSLRGVVGFPNPWRGSPNVLYIGQDERVFQLDAGAIRLDNTTSSPMAISSVVVELDNNPGLLFNPWGPFTIAPNSSAILTQTSQFNFDTSDFQYVGCLGAMNAALAPQIKVTLGDGTALPTFIDSGQVLNTFGYDRACVGNESIPWSRVGSANTLLPTLTLVPSAQTSPTGAGDGVDLTATLLDAGGSPLGNVLLTLTANTGPNAGLTATGTTDSNGQVTWDYLSSLAGTDVLQASATNVVGGTTLSNNANVAWTAGSGTSNSITVETPPVSAGATPELDSLFLFGSGLSGLAGYAMLRYRARRK